MRRVVLPSLTALCLFASPAAAAMSFEVTPHIGLGALLDTGLAYDPGIALGAAIAVRPLPWLQIQLHLLLNPLGINHDPQFQVDDPEALLTMYGMHIAARVLDAGPFEVLVGPHIGGFSHTVGGSDGFETVARRTAGWSYGATAEGWWRLTPIIAAGLRLQYSRLHPTEVCLVQFSDERCRDPLAAEDQPTAHLAALAGVRFSF